LQWLESVNAERVPARAVGTTEMPPIEDAPGSYVKVRA
jgi:polyhydroxyalkanoate synthase